MCGGGEVRMSAEVFVNAGEAAPRRTLAELRAALAQAGAPCTAEELADGPWLVLDGPPVRGQQTDMSLTVDPDGAVTSAMVQIGDEGPEALDRLFAAFQQLGWEVSTEDDD